MSDTLKGVEIKVGVQRAVKKQSDAVITAEMGDRNDD